MATLPEREKVWLLHHNWYPPTLYEVKVYGGGGNVDRRAESPSRPRFDGRAHPPRKCDVAPTDFVHTGALYGTTAVLADSHEITLVLSVAGIEFMLRATGPTQEILKMLFVQESP